MSYFFIDTVVEVICQALTDVLFKTTQIREIITKPSTENGQVIEVKNGNDEKFRIEVTKL